MNNFFHYLKKKKIYSKVDKTQERNNNFVGIVCLSTKRLTLKITAREHRTNSFGGIG